MGPVDSFIDQILQVIHRVWSCNARTVAFMYICLVEVEQIPGIWKLLIVMKVHE